MTASTAPEWLICARHGHGRATAKAGMAGGGPSRVGGLRRMTWSAAGGRLSYVACSAGPKSVLASCPLFQRIGRCQGGSDRLASFHDEEERAVDEPGTADIAA